MQAISRTLLKFLGFLPSPQFPPSDWPPPDGLPPPRLQVTPQLHAAVMPALVAVGGRS